jgi:hypothetical protein
MIFYSNSESLSFNLLYEPYKFESRIFEQGFANTYAQSTYFEIALYPSVVIVTFLLCQVSYFGITYPISK